MNGTAYIQIAEQHREELLREAESQRLVAQIKKSQHNKAMFVPPTFLSLYQQVKMLFSLRVHLRSQNTSMVTLTQSEYALRSTFALMRKKGLISDYDEHFVQQFEQTFERELARQGEMDRDVVASHA